MVCYSFCDDVCAHSQSDDLRQRMFDDETVSGWRNMLHDVDSSVRREALKVLGLAMNHSILSLLCWCLCSQRTGNLHHQLFNTETLSLWRSRLYHNDSVARQEALTVLRLAISHSMLHLLC